VQTKLRECIARNESGFSDRSWGSWSDDLTSAYRLFADLIGGRESEVVGIPNTSTGTSMVAQMIEPKPGTNVVLDDLAYNTAYPFTMLTKRSVQQRIVKEHQRQDGCRRLREGR
jgi:selenocysteine lyase/cysteine desulfurase